MHDTRDNKQIDFKILLLLCCE